MNNAYTSSTTLRFVSASIFARTWWSLRDEADGRSIPPVLLRPASVPYFAPIFPMEVVILGCGASSSSSSMRCLLGKSCHICREAQANDDSIPRNIKTNTNVLVDCGKTFREAALRVFPNIGVSANKPNGAHMNLTQEVKEIETIRPKCTLLIGMGHDLDYFTYSNLVKQIDLEKDLHNEMPCDGLCLAFP
ncbi:hypothetical protein JG687_00000259 [Phytophthora cactorum]|uniref:Uncharacterized protein n=1 Tax=Phytophthora cactorum TaxID=29920 RepID=A0A8T1V0I3_9STRA|nr:hypothetical protein JG687_00000259 [Phytophthora cactorum]